MSGWNIVDAITNKSLPTTGIVNNGVSSPYVTPAPGTQDPVGKMRVSQPQSLIDTDFEYGTQPTKWESISIQNNRQSAYYIPQQPLNVTSITGTTTLTITVAANITIAAGTPIYIQNATLDSNANGWWYTNSGVTAGTTFTVVPTTAVTAGEKFSATTTYVYAGYFYSNSSIRMNPGAGFTNVGSTITATTNSNHGLSKGSLVYVTNTVGPSSATNINGAYVVASVPTTTTFTYVSANGTPVFAVFPAGSSITTVDAAGAFSVTALTSGTMVVGQLVVVTGTNSGSSTLVAGTYRISATNGSTTFTLRQSSGLAIVTVAGANNNTGLTFTSSVGNSSSATVTTSNAGNNNIYARPAGYVEPRAFDGGVAFSSGAAVPNQQLIRQTRRYFRYQSGKGLQFSTGSSLCPTLLIASVTSTASTVTVTTRNVHSLAVGTVVKVDGIDQGGFNGQYTVATVPTPTTFTYTVAAALGTQTATGQFIRVNPITWYGAQNRLGMFDQQNGLFFEYDGQTLFAVWRSSTSQLNGQVAVTQGLSSVTGTNTLFSTQLTPGDFIVIRGQTYKVLGISSDTALQISPEYRGSTTSNAVVSRTVDVKVPQSQWADKLDGTGPSGYTLDLTKMQMWYIDYSWYGAGFIRWGLRTSKGVVTYVYQQTNNNIQFEAYMRSGNMAAHYESSGLNPTTSLTATLSSATTTSMSVANTALFPPTGSIRIVPSSGNVEIISYTGKTATSFTGLTRGVTGGSAATTYTYSATAPISVEYADNDTACALSHWGSSVIMDGLFNDDKSLIFNFGTNAQFTLNTSTSQVTPILAIRIAPSVDNGITGTLGSKEIINRMQLQLLELGVVTSGPVLINLILNGYTSGGTWTSFTSPVSAGVGAYSSSLAQIAYNTANGTLVGGESVAAAFTNTNGQTTLDLSQVRDLGNSILGGGTVNTVPTSYSGVYPDGPDILYVCATNVVAAATPNILARLSWKEAQA
jgi:hypothetical protein